LRHLPDVGVIDMFRTVDAAADEDAAISVEDGQSGAWSMGQRFKRGHASERPLVMHKLRHVVAELGPFGHTTIGARRSRRFARERIHN
jgi:hypothetical protein